MSKVKWIVDLLTPIVGSKETAEMVVEVLTQEGVLALGYGDVDVDKVVDQFKETFGTTKITKYDRFAARRLSAKYGSQAITGIIRLLAEHSDKRYAPVVGSVAQLEEKMVSVLNFLRNQQGEEMLDV